MVTASPPRPVAASQLSPEPAAPTQVRVQAAYGQLPLHFEANAGQSDEQVEFLSRGSGYTLFLTATEAVLALRKPAPAGHGDAETRRHGEVGTVAVSSPRPRFGGEACPERSRRSQGEGAVLRMRLVGANPNPQGAGLEELPGKSNYFLSNDPSKWRTGVSQYAKVKYEGIYPGIDLIYYGNQRQLEYDFIVAPRADPKVIKLVFEGADKIEIDAPGNLILLTEGGERGSCHAVTSRRTA